MIRHTLGIFFTSFIGICIFVNLYQFSGAIMPFELPFDSNPTDYQHSFFGISSIITFFQNLGNDSGISTAIAFMNTGIKVTQTFSVDTIVQVFDNINEIIKSNPALLVVYIVAAIFNIIKDILMLPIAGIVTIICLFVGLFTFIWQLLTYFFKFVVGYYNVPLDTYQVYEVIRSGAMFL